MKPLIQPTKTTCGQTCVAMVTGRTVPEIVKLLDSGGNATTIELIMALRACGFLAEVGEVGQVGKGKLPKRAICLRKYRKKSGFRKKGHWVLLWDGKIYDPLAPEIVSFIDITRKKKRRKVK